MLRQGWTGTSWRFRRTNGCADSANSKGQEPLVVDVTRRWAKDAFRAVATIYEKTASNMKLLSEFADGLREPSRKE
jgi:hypothetical protein